MEVELSEVSLLVPISFFIVKQRVDSDHCGFATRFRYRLFAGCSPLQIFLSHKSHGTELRELAVSIKVASFKLSTAINRILRSFGVLFCVPYVHVVCNIDRTSIVLWRYARLESRDRIEM